MQKLWHGNLNVYQMKVLNHPALSDNSPTPRLDYFNKTKFRVYFDGNCLTTVGFLLVIK